MNTTKPKQAYLHPVPLDGAWALVTSDEAAAVTINAKVVAERMNEHNARALSALWNAAVAAGEINPDMGV